MKSDQLRQAFLDYFKQRGHTVVPSSSLVPEADPTLLFTIAGMVQFKPYYASTGPIPFTRAATVQKCLRATDLEEVGRTIKHHTFFEMLGNFSFGDYFKEEAIQWGWDFLTRVVGIPGERLHVSVYTEDEESERLWKTLAGVPAERIIRLGDEHNFWGPAGATGACGPCSEMHFDRGTQYGCKRPDCSPACSCDRFVEVWNLVFPQFYKEADGRLRPLERRGVDTGMGLERLTLVAQGAASNFDTDIFKPVIAFISDEAGERADAAHQTSVKVIADHARALAFAISEGVLPSNEGRGYVIRRILRRAVVKALDLGIEDAFIYKVAGSVIDAMRGAYPELAERREQIAIVIKSDEERFERTLARGMAIFNDVAARLEQAGGRAIPGKDVFVLYDTYGFPVDITRELAETRGLTLDIEGFEREMEDQRQRARQGSRIGKETEARDDAHLGETFVGYDSLEVPTVVSSVAGAAGGRIAAGEEADVGLERTPFYPEGGGQVGDTGTISGPEGRAVVTAVRWAAGGISHRVKVEQGSLGPGDGVVARVDVERRKATQRNHTATHLLQAALRSILGAHVRQSGSLVAPDRFRFDFTHYEPLSDADLRSVEDTVNRRIMDDIPVRIGLEDFEKARARGAMALFGEKYGEQVRVVEVEGTSCELCGGTHVRATGEIGSFKVVSESGIAAGTRRIEAVTGQGALETGRQALDEVAGASAALRVPPHGLLEGARKAADRIKALEKEVAELRQRVAGSEVGEILKAVVEVKGIKVAAATVEVPDGEVLKHLADRALERLGDGVVCLGGRIEDRAAIVVSVGPAAIAAGVKASAVAKKLGELVGGRGGGRDNFAQAGGKNPGMLEEAIGRCADAVAGLTGDARRE